MPIKIYTYADPYHIDDELYWNEIKDCPQFCVSQTMVNGLNATYPHFKKFKQLSTIRTLVDALYDDWNSLNTKVRQIIEVDNVISKIDEISREPNQLRSMQFNAKSIANCIRLFSELGLNSNEFKTDYLNIDQVFLVEIYKQIVLKTNSCFMFERVKNCNAIDSAIEQALLKQNAKVEVANLNTDTVVIHGIHQFSPAMLCAIEDISKYKTVILLFNYQNQYSKVYETWLNIYSLFNLPIPIGSEDREFTPTSLYVDSFDSNALADSMGKIIEGQYKDYYDGLKNLEVIEFENLTEFANYVAKIYESARNECKKGGKPSPLAQMNEQFYAASSKVNDILRAYFPEQFEERHFLDYPIGHFFVATTNLWDPEERRIRVNSFSDLKECLEAGIISEARPGQLVNCLNKVIPYIENELYLDSMIKALISLTKYVDSKQPIKDRIGYFNVSKEDLRALANALEELQKIINYFFSDFEEGGDNFKRFYARIQKFISNNVDVGEIDDTMRNVIKKLLDKLEKTNLPEEGTFHVLKQTMSVYLSQDDNPAAGAHWIVRGFEQIDGDILRSNQNGFKNIYHFCALSDKDICASQELKLPWPLEPRFFEYAQVPTDWKYQIFLKSKLEYNNFNRYALLYGLEFNRMPCKLSYIKNEGQKENDLYHIFSLLGIKVTKYKPYVDSAYQERISYVSNGNKQINFKNDFTDLDLIKASICPYRFALESVIQGNTVFRDRFLIQMYMRVLIRTDALKKLANEKADISKLQVVVAEIFEEYKDKFKIADELERTQLLYLVCNDIYNKYVKRDGTYWNINTETKYWFDLAQDFLLTDKTLLNKIEPSKLEELFAQGTFRCNHGKHCMYCSCKDICLEYHNFEN